MKTTKTKRKVAKKRQKTKKIVEHKKPHFPYIRITVNLIILTILFSSYFGIKYIKTEIENSEDQNTFLKYTTSIKPGDNKLTDISEKFIDYPINEKITTTPCTY